MTGHEYDNVSARGRAPARDEAELRELLDARATGDRRDAALGLVDCATGGLAAETVSALEERVGADPDPDVRQFAVEALGVASAGTATVENALGDGDPWVRAEAVVALSRVGGSDAVDLLDRALDDESGAVRRNALIALAKLGEVEADTLRRHLKEDPHGPVREYAAEWLGTRPGAERETVTLLAAVLARDPEAFVRANAATSLGELGTERAIEALESQGLADRSNDVQRAARRGLATARGRAPDEVDLDDPPAPGGGPRTPSRDSDPVDPHGRSSGSPRPTGRGSSGLRGNATRRIEGTERGGGDR